MDDSIHIYTATWLPEDHISELNSILEGVSVDDVEKKLITYVVENIEPCGWKGVWQPEHEKIKDLFKEVESLLDSFIVEVNHVSVNVLEAHVVILDGIKNGFKLSPINSLYVGKSLKVPLIQLFPLAHQENSHVDITGTAEVVEQVRFFYEHVWLPWDVEEDFCYYEESVISQRIKLYQDIANNIIPADVCKELESIVTEAKKIRLLIDVLKLSAEDSIGKGIEEEDLVQLIKFHKSLDELKSRHKYVKDPVLRGIAAHYKLLERRSLIESFSSEDTSDILLVCTSSSPDEFLSAVRKLPQLLKELPNVSDDAKIKTFPFLQLALDTCKTGDTVVLLPGRYSLSQLGELANGGTICGLEGLVEIVGCSSCGDVMLDLNLDSVFAMRSVELLPFKNQSAVVVHSGEIVMENCSIKDCSVGVTLLSGSKCKMVDCVIQSTSHSLDCRSGSQLTICNSMSNDILKGPMYIEEGAEVVNENENKEKQKTDHF